MRVELDLNNPNMVQETELSKKLTIDGTTKAYPVYKIRLDQLYYNNQNDRIATWISRYNAEKGTIEEDSPDYNNIIHEMIKESNEDAFKKTKNNIRDFEQRESGVVLKDGRIIDGNRRFTCLRELSREDAKFNWFDAVILNNTYEDEYGIQLSQRVKLYSHDFDFFGRPTGFFTTMGFSASPSFSRTFAFFSMTRIVLHPPFSSLCFLADRRISMVSP